MHLSQPVTVQVTSLTLFGRPPPRRGCRIAQKTRPHHAAWLLFDETECCQSLASVAALGTDRASHPAGGRTVEARAPAAETVAAPVAQVIRCDRTGECGKGALALGGDQGTAQE